MAGTRRFTASSRGLVPDRAPPIHALAFVETGSLLIRFLRAEQRSESDAESRSADRALPGGDGGFVALRRLRRAGVAAAVVGAGVLSDPSRAVRGQAVHGVDGPARRGAGELVGRP